MIFELHKYGQISSQQVFIAINSMSDKRNDPLQSAMAEADAEHGDDAYWEQFDRRDRLCSTAAKYVIQLARGIAEHVYAAPEYEQLDVD